MQYVLMLALSIVALFLIVLVLIQRGRGGGLAGALGGLGGQSAFGTKAGDVFTRVTIVVAGFWIALCALAVKLESGSGSRLTGAYGSALPQPSATPPASGDAAPQTPDATAGGESGASLAPAQPQAEPPATPPLESAPPASEP